MSNVNEADIFSAKGLPAREQVSEWFNIKEKIGTKIAGVFQGWWISPANKAGFKDQIGVALLVDGKILGVSLGDTPYMRSRIEPSQVGDRVGLKYEGDKDTGQIQPAKIIKFYNPDLEERRAKGTVVISKPEQLSKTEVEKKADDAFDALSSGDEDQPF